MYRPTAIHDCPFITPSNWRLGALDPPVVPVYFRLPSIFTMNGRTFSTLLLLAFASVMNAAQLRVHGTVTNIFGQGPLKEVLVRVYKDGEKQHVIHTNANGRYSVRLDNNASYVLRFSLPGHVTKCFTVDTHGPSWEGDNKLVDLEVEMTLFEQLLGLDLSFFDMPMGIARFTPMTGVISWNDGYGTRIRPEVERLMAEVRTRREELASSSYLPPAGPHVR
jgi:hypothetical protein